MTKPREYVKRPVVIEAVQYTAANARSSIRAFARENWNDGNIYDKLHDSWIRVKYFDWIIKGTEGEFYPCDRDVFDKVYKLYDPDPPSRGRLRW